MGLSLCTGTGALDLALQRRIGVAVTVFAEVDPLASRVVGRHWPDARNLGDLTTVDWDEQHAGIDWLVAGYPCQPFSLAGRREGQADQRHLWPFILTAIRRLRPERIMLENVPGHRSSGFGTVLGDLAALGYDARWCSVRACDVGAPHIRERVFITAHAQDHRRDRRGQSRHPARGGLTGPAHGDLGHGDRAVADPAGGARPQGRQPAPGQAQGWITAQRDARRRDREVDWGVYAQAVRRWESVIGRPAPSPVRRGARGATRLSPAFVEWMMGLPERWVTGITAPAKHHLRLLGNSVVPQQAEAAFDLLGVS